MEYLLTQAHIYD